MNRIAITVDRKGEIEDIRADEPAEVYWICPYAPNDEIYNYTRDVKVGPEHVDEAIGDLPVDHSEDDLGSRCSSGPEHVEECLGAHREDHLGTDCSTDTHVISPRARGLYATPKGANTVITVLVPVGAEVFKEMEEWAKLLES